MDPSPSATPPIVPDRLPCIGCGYDLVGLPEDGACPECGVAIGRSISGDHLFASSKAHRRKLARGAKLAVLGAWAGWVSITLLAVYALVARAIGPQGAAGAPAAIAMACMFVGSGLGWRDLTTADPDRIGDTDERWVRRFVLRLYALFLACAAPFLPLGWLGLLVVSLVVSVVGGRGFAADSSLWIIWVAMLPALPLSGAIAAEVSGLARRLLEGDLADRSRGLSATGWVAFGLVVVTAQFVWFRPGGWWWLLEPLAWTVTSIALLAWSVQYHTLVRALRIALAAVAARP